MAGKNIGRRRTGAVNEKGYTLIISVIIMAVLLIIGMAVLTAAANSLNAVNSRTESRQAYYVAKSALNTLDQSMQGGALGKCVRTRAFGALSDGSQESGIYELSDQKMTVSKVQLQEDNGAEADEGISAYEIQDLKLQYSGRLQSLQESGIEGQLVDLEISLSFTAVSGRDTYKMKADYRYSGTAYIRSGQIAWGQEEWELINVSQ